MMPLLKEREEAAPNEAAAYGGAESAHASLRKQESPHVENYEML